ncbi:hypothetical protein A0H81_03473 [Grifola frondosa]|uniref:Uncharacterized protein n=1 Tax=Grifola frondosa TaxID=5627 RepID=A0A1C7MHF2_GRIFR|nr:hypothetical protein A0H81_03473 [Grifola frondosa]
MGACPLRLHSFTSPSEWTGEDGVDNQAYQVCTFSSLLSLSLRPVCLDVNQPPANGSICVALLDARLDELEISAMVSNNQDSRRTSYMIAIDRRMRLPAFPHMATPSPPHRPHTRLSFTIIKLFHSSKRHHPTSRAFQRRPRTCGYTESGIDFWTTASIPQAGVLYEFVGVEMLVQWKWEKVIMLMY